MDHILQMMEVAWRQVNTARGSTVKLANPEHNLLVSLECARDFMLGLLTEPDPGRQRLGEIFGGDCSRIARVRAILDGATLSHRNCTDDRISSCMSAVKSVEAVLKKDCGVGRRLSEAQRKELTRLRERQSRFQARHLRGEFSPLSKNGSPSQSRSSWFGFEAETNGSADDALPPRPRAGSAPSLRGELGQSVSSFHQSWQALRDHWESGNLFRNPWMNTSKDEGCKGSRDSSATCSRRSTLEAAEPAAGADSWSGLNLVADPRLDDADPRQAPGNQSSIEDSGRCISDFKNDAMLTAEAGIQPSETPSTWVEDEPDAAAVRSPDWEETVPDGAVSTTSDNTSRAQNLDHPRSCESASCKSAVVHLDLQGMEDDDVTLESPPSGGIEEQSAEGDPDASRAPARLDFVPPDSDAVSATAAAEEAGGSLSTESNDRPVPGSLKPTPECDSPPQSVLPAEPDADRQQVGQARRFRSSYGVDVLLLQNSKLCPQDGAMEAAAPNAEKGRCPSETQSPWVEDEPEAAAVGSTDWEETLQDGDKPRSCESASCKSAVVHLDLQGMEDDDVTLESPPSGGIEEQSAEGDPDASRAPARLDFVPPHSDAVSATAAAEEAGGSLSTETLGQTVLPGMYVFL
ncbi:unnamed protein product [Symbiodinium sp. CCMP2592]|nr:unnamed protein product [Symbiodinium sp. CCMP2592]